VCVKSSLFPERKYYLYIWWFTIFIGGGYRSLLAHYVRCTPLAITKDVIVGFGHKSVFNYAKNTYNYLGIFLLIKYRLATPSPRLYASLYGGSESFSSHSHNKKSSPVLSARLSFPMAVIFYTLREPFLNETADSPHTPLPPRGRA
jgi:hypothetical protein